MKAVVSLSGGMDSATVLAEALSSEREVEVVSFQYDSKHNHYEIASARKIAQHYNVHHRVIDARSIFKGIKSNLLTGQGAIPEGHYHAESMSQTVVPGRNMIFASVLAGVAWSRGAAEVWLGIHAGDHEIYPDCRPKFFTHMKNAALQATDGAVMLVAPFLQMDKTEILVRGSDLQVPYHLTRTCYKQQSRACGKCGACQERLEAFSSYGAADPLEYERA